MTEIETIKHQQEMAEIRATFNAWWSESFEVKKEYFSQFSSSEIAHLTFVAWSAWKSAHDFKKAWLTEKGIEA